MSEENNETSKSEIKTPLGSLSFSGKRMAEFISVLLLCLMAVLAYAFWNHSVNVETHGNQLIGVLKELHSGNMASVKEQRVMNCLLTIKQDDRRSALADCERIAR